ncbi:MAG: type III pantothenate kinase [Cognaticolwellia sp.]
MFMGDIGVLGCLSQYLVDSFYARISYQIEKLEILKRKMKLIIDIGNSDIVFGIYKEEEWQYIWRTPSDLRRSLNGFKTYLLEQFRKNKIDKKQIEKVVLSSVVPKLTPVISNLLHTLFYNKLLVVNPLIYSQLNIKIVRNPNEIGTDLVANAVAGFHYAKVACIVVDFGTALTFTSISNNGEIQGVAIAPGIKTAMKALAANAAQLPEIPLELPKSVIGKDTIHAIQAGILWGYVGLVKGILKQTKLELGENCKVIATGGLSHVLAPLEKEFDFRDKNLTLNGLRLIGDFII